MARYFDTPLSSDTQTRTLQIIEGIARFLRLLPQLPASSSGPGMATVTKSIGTTSRDYSTITSWEADLDNGAVYSASDDAVGECYNDSAFDEGATVDINGGGTIGLSSVTLSVAAGERHDGTAGSGVRIVPTGSGGVGYHVIEESRANLTIEWLEIDGVGGSGFFYQITTAGGNNSNCVFRHLLLHGATGTSNNGGLNLGGIAFRAVNAHRNIIYDHVKWGVVFSGSDCKVYNNTVFDCGTEGFADVPNRAGADVRNNIAMSCGTDFDWLGTSGTCNYNASSDATADDGEASPPANNLINQTAGDQFVSTVGGSEDLHLKSGADCIDAGVDLSGLGVSGLSTDIDGNAVSGTWDIGADEFEAGAGSFQAAWAMGATLVLGVAGGA